MKFYEFIRKISVPPVFAAISCVILTVINKMSFLFMAISLIFLCLFPAISYIICELIPNLKKGGRKTQRKTAVIFSVAGYVISFLLCFLFGANRTEYIFFGTYLISGILIAIFSLCGYKASGHSCGICGPVAMLSSYVSLWYLLGLIPLFIVCLSSYKLKRHTVMQLIIGGEIPIFAMIIMILLSK